MTVYRHMEPKLPLSLHSLLSVSDEEVMQTNQDQPQAKLRLKK